MYPLLPRAQRPDTNVAIDAALPEPAAVKRQDLPPTIVEIGTTSQPQTEPSARRRASRKPSRKRRRNRSAGVFWPPNTRRPRDTGVIKITLCYKQLTKVTVYEQLIAVTWYKQVKVNDPA